ncbi:protein croquemort-like isoform X2 [Prorops nasuta]
MTFVAEIPSGSQESEGTKSCQENQNGIQKSTKMMHSYKKLAIFCSVGAVAIIIGITTGSCWSIIYDWFLRKELTLSPTSKSFQIWEQTPIPMYLRIHMFNWTNYKEFYNKNGIKPHFVELGPYVFREVDYKVNKIWNSNGTVTFQRRRVWHFEESMSNGSLDDQITNINAVAASVAYTVRYQKKIVRDIVNGIMISLGERLVVTKSVRELIFDGYDDKVLRIARKMKATTIPYDKFGWFFARNGSDSYDGTFNMLTGVNNFLGLGMIKEWNYSNQSKYYQGECGIVKGSNGDLWPPLPDNKTVSIFIPDMCTNVDLELEGTTVFQGLTGNRYISRESMLDNGTYVKSRECYCKDIDCLPSGVMNISQCKFNAPAFVSLPHFYLADSSYRDAISGMNPSKEKHETYLTVEPITGIPMEVKAQLQLNILVQPDDAMSLFRNIPTTYIPILWFDQDTQLTSEYSSLVKMILILSTTGYVTFFGIAAIGLFVSLIGLFIYIREKRRNEDNQGLLARDNNRLEQTGG